MTSLAGRVAEAIADAERRGISIKDIATACGVTVQSVYQWKKPGERVEIEGTKLVELAVITGYEALWIMKGKGPKKRVYARNDKQAKAMELMQQMEEGQQAKAVKSLICSLNLTANKTRKLAKVLPLPVQMELFKCCRMNAQIVALRERQ